MSRVDVPTLECDRCQEQTRDLNEMGRFVRIERYHMSGKDEWDLCPACWISFTDFVGTGGS